MKVLVASTTTFAATNIDDIFLLTLLVSRNVPPRRIVAGQYVGFAFIILLSCLGAIVALAIPTHWIRFLGLLPIALGVRGLLRLRRPQENNGASTPKRSPMAIAVITFLTGADNVGVYVPFFRLHSHELGWIVIVYAMLVGVWCLVGIGLGHHPLVLKVTARIGRWLAPTVFIGLGIYMLAT
jgi:cadmium resistance protein CadD (predicted permease)